MYCLVFPSRMKNLLVFFCAIYVVKSELYELNIVHYNDFHARFVETSLAGRICDPSNGPCIGGFARLVTLIREAVAREPHSLVLNGGDSFQGTIWYNLLRWNVTQDFMNMIDHDAHVLGNHEFDNGIDGLVPYLQHLNAPVVTANINDDDEPTIQGLYQPSITVEKNGRKIGIIGVLISTTPEMAVTGNLKFTDEVEAVKNESEKLHAEGVDIIVVLSHCGLDIDKDIALNSGSYVDIIVGAHSHSLLYNSDLPEGIPFENQGPYPTVVENEDRSVLIVHAAANTAFLGEIKLYFNDQGELTNWTGNPHYVANEIEQASDVLEKIEEYLPLITERASAHVGVTKVQLSSNCACTECNLGNFICDSMIDAAIEKAEGSNWGHAHFCIINRGNIRTGIEPGNVTFEQLLQTSPYENNIEIFELQGKYVLEMLEYALSNTGTWTGARMLQVSGMRAAIDGSQPVNSRVTSVTIRCIECDVPRYEPLDEDKMYRIVTQSFIGGGGDGFTMISDNRQNVEVLGVDYVLLQEYMERMSPVMPDVDGRLQLTNPCI